MSKTSPRRRTRRYDEDFEYFVPLRHSTTSKRNEENSAADNNSEETPKRKRGRPPGSKNIVREVEPVSAKRGPGRPRKYNIETVVKQETESEDLAEKEETENVVFEEKETQQPKKQLNLGEVLELAVKSALNSSADEEEDEKYEETKENSAEYAAEGQNEEENNDFEWKVGNEAEESAAKRARLSMKSDTSCANEGEDSGNEEGVIRIRTINDSEGAKIECLTCHRIMKPGSLRAHLRTHAHERPHTCDMCEARFTRRGDLERHIKVIHQNERPFKCYKCHRTFGDKKNLRWHLANHDRKLFYHCQECGFKFGKREYWENHVRYIHPIPGGEVEPLPAEASEGEPAAATPIKMAKSPAILPKGTPVTLPRAASQKKSIDPFSGIRPQKVVFPPTYWDEWDEFMERTMVLHFRPQIEKFGSQGRPLRRRRIPETLIEIRPSDRPDSSFDIDTLPEDQPILDEKEGAFIDSKGEVIGYPEEMLRVEGGSAEEELEEEEEEMEDVEAMKHDGVEPSGEIALDEEGELEQASANGEVLATHHLVYGDDGQVRLILGSGNAAGASEVVTGATDENEDLSVSHAFVEANGQIVILQPDGSAVLAPPGGQLLDTGDGQLILLQTLEDGTQTAVAYTAAPQDPLQQGEVAEETGEAEEVDTKPDVGESNQDAVQTLIDAVQELIDNRDKPS